MQSVFSTTRARSRRRGRIVARGTLAVVLGMLTAGLFVAPASWGAIPAPKARVVAPAVVEDMQPYVPQTSCDPTLKSGVKKFRALMLKTYDRGTDGGVTRACTAGGKSEHYEGRAWDFMLNAKNKKDKATADALIAWLMKVGPDGQKAYEARRLGIMYVMYNKKIWGTWDGKWKAISKGSHQHTDHIHFSFSWAGAKGRTSFWTGKVAAFDYGPCRAYKGQPARIYSKPNSKPCATNLPAAPKSTHKLAWTGSRSKDVATAQSLLKVPVAKRTKSFGTTVRKAVIAYQRAKKLPVTGALDKATWVTLDPKSRLASPPPVTTTGNAAAKPAASSWVTVTTGSRGAGVLKVQKALKMAPAACTSTFDAPTLAAVKAFQAAKKLVVDGIVGPKTATALGLVA